ANLVTDAAEAPGHSRRDVFLAWKTLEETVRRHPQLLQVRRRLIDYTMRPEINRLLDAVAHIEFLRNSEQADADLEVKLAECQLRLGQTQEARKALAGLIGYDL